MQYERPAIEKQVEVAVLLGIPGKQISPPDGQDALDV
jgi:hypothetical protein